VELVVSIKGIGLHEAHIASKMASRYVAVVRPPLSFESFDSPLPNYCEFPTRRLRFRR
jgi:hypothetical protein